MFTQTLPKTWQPVVWELNGPLGIQSNPEPDTLRKRKLEEKKTTCFVVVRGAPLGRRSVLVTDSTYRR